MCVCTCAQHEAHQLVKETSQKQREETAGDSSGTETPQGRERSLSQNSDRRDPAKASGSALQAEEITADKGSPYLATSRPTARLRDPGATPLYLRSPPQSPPPPSTAPR